MDNAQGFLKILREQASLRQFFAWKKDRVRLKFIFGWTRRLLRNRTFKMWSASRGAFIPLRNAQYFFVPKELELHGYTVITRGLADNYLASYLARFCKLGSTVIDIGANIGEMTHGFAEAVGQDGKVVAFEPIPFLADAIKKTAQINGYDFVQVVNAAVSSKLGTLHIDVRYSPDKIVDSGGSQVKEAPTATSVPVDTVTLDSWCRNNLNLSLESKISLVKIDVEGHELDVLEGARSILASQKPVLVLEIGHESVENRKAIARILSEIGYSPTAVLFRHGFLPLNWDDLVGMSGPLTQNSSYDIIFHCVSK